METQRAALRTRFGDIESDVGPGNGVYAALLAQLTVLSREALAAHQAVGDWESDPDHCTFPSVGGDRRSGLL